MGNISAVMVELERATRTTGTLDSRVAGVLAVRERPLAVATEGTHKTPAARTAALRALIERITRSV